MKRITTLVLLIALTISALAQHAQVINGQIVRTGGIPSRFERPDGTTVWGGYRQLTHLHYADGWRDIVLPNYNRASEKLINLHYDSLQDVATYEVATKTDAEIAAQKDGLLQQMDEQFNYEQIKALLRLLSKPLLENDSITSGELEVLTGIYKQYRPDNWYEAGEVFVYETTLYRVVQPHTSQSDWLPDATPALYTPFTPPGQVAQWIQPTGAHDAYNTGDKVLFNGSTYESLINANTWSPTAYPAGWQLIE